MGRFHYQRCLRFGMAAPPLVAHETYSHLVVVVVVIVVVVRSFREPTQDWNLLPRAPRVAPNPCGGVLIPAGRPVLRIPYLVASVVDELDSHGHCAGRRIALHVQRSRVPGVEEKDHPGVFVVVLILVVLVVLLLEAVPPKLSVIVAAVVLLLAQDPLLNVG